MRDYRVKYLSMPAAKIFIPVAAFLLLVVLTINCFGVLVGNNDAYADTQNSSTYSSDNELGLIKPGTLTVATSPDYPPFALLVGDSIVGYEADIWNDIARRLGLNIEVKSLNFDSIMTAVASGTQVDIGVSGISITPERAKTVAFSQPYYEADISFAVPENSAITSDNATVMLTDKELNFAVQSGTTAESYVREHYPKAKISAYSNANDCFSAVSAGLSDVVCSTKAVVVNMLHGNYSDMKIVKNVATGEEYGIAVCQQNDDLLTAINKCLDEMKADGSLAKFATNNEMSVGANTITATNQDVRSVMCSASTNSDASSDVLAGKPTRVTWEGIVGDSKTASSFSFELPDNSNADFSQTKITLLTGDDLTHRTTIDTELSWNQSTVVAKFINPKQLQNGGYYRVEIYDVEFPECGGYQHITGSCGFEDGSVSQIDDAPDIYARQMNAWEKFADWLDSLEIVQAWNSIKFCNLFLNPSIFVRSIPIVFNGFLMALLTVVCAFPIAVPIGLIFALMRLSSRRLLRGIAAAYVNIVRGTPLFLQIYIAFFGLPLAGVNIPNFLLGLIVLAMNSSAYLCEIIRAGIQSINKGQFEASRSLGMTKSQTFIYVILPQTVQRIIPTMTSEFILLFKDTSLLASVGVMEVVMYAKTIVASTGSITPYIVAALFYLVVTIPLAKIVSKIEQAYSSRRTRKITVKASKKNRSIGESVKNESKVFPNTVSEQDRPSHGINPDVMGSV